MLSFITSFLPTSYFIPEWLTLDINPLDGLLQGLVGACGISVLCSLLRVHLFKKSIILTYLWLLNKLIVICFDTSSPLFICSIISQESKKFLQQLLVQSQFSLGCALTCSLCFLHEGSSQRWLCLLLAAALSWFLARQATSLLHHVMALYKLHSSQRYCGICISLLTSGSSVLPMLCRAMIITFSVAGLAAVSIINRHFLSATEALRFWTPLTICYTLLVVYMQEEQHRLPSSQAVLNAVMVRLGGLMVLMLTVGRWADVLHILMCFLGEASCLIPAKDLLDAAASQVSESPWKQHTGPKALSVHRDPKTGAEYQCVH
uniref:Transmembrane protein 82 n=1 Tax=Acanthochromis polyacanthus TaxID=80966 RepID=A0A3Q1EUC8_9TELE